MLAHKLSLLAAAALTLLVGTNVLAGEPAKAATKGQAPTTQPAATAAPAPTTQPAATPTTQPADKAEPVAVDIPLHRVSAIGMPGTQPLEISYATDGQSLTNVESVLLSEILASLKKFGPDARGGFAVNGVDLEVIEAAHRLLVQEQDPVRLSRQRQIAVVFFSYQQGMDVHVRRVVQKGSQVEISYYKVPRGDQEFHAQIAIVPLERVPAGSLKVVLSGQLDPAFTGSTAMGDARDSVFVVTMK